MDTATFTVQMVRALAWPAVVGFVFWNVREPVGSLIANIRQLKWKEAQATFGEVLDRVEESLPIAALQAQETEAGSEKLENLPPAYIVMTKWKHVEFVLQGALAQAGYRLTKRNTDHLRPELLKDRLGLSDEEIETVRQLHELRQRAVHEFLAEQVISLTDALRYKDLADVLINKLTPMATGGLRRSKDD